MAKLNSQRFTVESFKEQEKWISPLLAGLNQFFGEIIQSYGNNLTVEENLSQEIKELKFVNQTANFPIKFRAKIQQSPKCLYVGYVYNQTDDTSTLSAAPYINWTYVNGDVHINSIVGLTANKTYIIRLHIVYN